MRRGVAVIFYTKPNCPLCEEAEELLEEMEDLFGFFFSKVNILEDIDAYKKYQHRIPVIELGDNNSLSGRIKRNELKQRIKVFMGSQEKKGKQS